MSAAWTPLGAACGTWPEHATEAAGAARRQCCTSPARSGRTCGGGGGGDVIRQPRGSTRQGGAPVGAFHTPPTCPHPAVPTEVSHPPLSPSRGPPPTVAHSSSKRPSPERRRPSRGTRHPPTISSPAPPPSSSSAARDPAEELVQGPISNKKCEKKVPKKVHKSEREKRKRDTQNDLFDELGKMLEPDRQNNGKACILSDTTRILKDLFSQVESLQKENSALKNESHYVALERNELFDENSSMRNEILDLQNELRVRLEGNPIWTHGTTRSNLAVPHPATQVFALQQSPHTPVITTMALPLQQSAVLDPSYAAPRRELQLFPETTATEDNERRPDREISNHVTRPQARYPTTTVTLPGQVYPALPRMEDEQCSSGTTDSGAEDGQDNA